MTIPERFSNLPQATWLRLRSLLDAHNPGGDPINMSIGEPKHAFPEWVGEILVAHMNEMGRYPANHGTPELLNSIAGWVSRRYGVEVALDRQVMALNGTREGLFNAAIALCPERTSDGLRPAVLVPNPFYQVYAVAAMAVGAEPVFVDATEDSGFLPDYASLPEEILARTEIAYVCSPSNPQGAVASREYLAKVIGLAEEYDFKVFSDECYSELYEGEPPVGALTVASEMGVSPERVLLFNSLSKRSNLAGLRSGIVVGGPEAIAEIKRLRAYAGAPLPQPLQRVSERAWADEKHVEHNRALYCEKYKISTEILGDVPGFQAPKAGFFLWLPVGNGEEAALKLWRDTGVRTLPGAYLGAGEGPANPGHGYIRVALVAPIEDVQRALVSLRSCLYG